MKRKIPLSVPNLSMDILENIKETIETGWVSTGGRFIEEFEKKVLDYVDANYSVGVQSGTAGIHLALKALGVNKNDEVIVPTLTFIASVNPVKYLGAEPIFIDCDEDLNISPGKIRDFLYNNCYLKDGKTINKKTGRHIKAMIVVHVFGNPANMEELVSISKEYNIKILEDAAEALGSYYKKGKYKGKHCGTIGDIGVYSFNANKIITTGGGGMVVSDNKEYIDKISFWSRQSKTDSLYYIHDEIGYNYRMTNIQAAFGTDQIDRIEDFIRIKKRNYDYYKDKLKNIPGIKLIDFNRETRPNYWFIGILIDEDEYGVNRDDLLKILNERNIQSRPLWGLIHKQKPYIRNEAYDIRNAYYYEKNLLNIPNCSTLDENELKYVVKTIGKINEYGDLNEENINIRK